MRKRWTSKRAAVTAVCEVCGCVLGRVFGSFVRKTCSRACWDKLRVDSYNKRVVEAATCEACGKTFERTVRKNKRLWCKDACRAKLERRGWTDERKECEIERQRVRALTRVITEEQKEQRRIRGRERRALGLVTPGKHRYTCEWCSVEYRAKSKDRDRFCSRTCYYEWWSDYNRKKYPPKPKLTVIDVCVLCGDEYEVENIQQDVCRNGCSVELQRLKNLSTYYENRKNMHDECVGCGALFGEGWHNGRRLCDICLDASFKRARRRGKERRKARMHDVAYEPVDSVEIFERDGWRCQQCKKKVRPDFNVNHPRYPHLDHIVPLSRGGPHVRENLQCLCRECNMDKGDALVGQMLLIG